MRKTMTSSFWSNRDRAETRPDTRMPLFATQNPTDGVLHSRGGITVYHSNDVVTPAVYRENKKRRQEDIRDLKNAFRL